MRPVVWTAVILMAPLLSGCSGGGASGTQATDDEPLLDAAAYHQAGYDAARTGNVPGEGPTEHEIAFVVDLPGLPEHDVSPLIMDGHVYVLGRSTTPAPPGTGPAGQGSLLTINTSTAETTSILTFDAPASSMASDGTYLYIAEAGRVAAYLPSGGQPVWTRPFPRLQEAAQAPSAEPEHHVWTRCAHVAVLDGSLYIACTQEIDDRRSLGDPSLVGGALTHPVSRPLFLRLDAHDGAVQWQWPGPGDAAQSIQGNAQCLTSDVAMMRLEGLSVPSPERVLVIANHEPDHYKGGDSAGQYSVYALDAAEETVAWRRCLAPTAYWYAMGRAGNPSTDVVPAVTASNEAVFILHATLDVHDLETGEMQQRVELQETGGLDAAPGPQTTNHMTGVVTHGKDLWLQAVEDIIHVDIASGDARIDWQVRHGHGHWERYYPLVAGDLLYAVQPELVRAVHAHEGRHVWSHEIRRTPAYLEAANQRVETVRAPGMAVGEGLLVVVSTVNEVFVFGRTPLSIQPAAHISDTYPAVGEDVVVDVSATGPSAGGALEYRADWGDGTLTSWQDSPQFVHAYSRLGDREARFMVRSVDPDGRTLQQSVAVVPLEVGGSPQEQLNVLQHAFASQNQDMTFGVLGVALALGGGLAAVLARRRRHGRLQRELAAIDAAAAPVRGNPTRLVAAMEERRAHCHGLLVDHRIDEAQYTVLEKRIEAVARGARTHQMHDLFDFLPHGMVTALEEMLADGRITKWEHDSFHVVLRENRALTASQKQKVAQLIDQWFAQDLGMA